MADLSAFPITRRWPAANPDVIQLYSRSTPNGVKVAVMLEETGLPYEPHLIRFADDDQLTPEFLSLNPNNKIPAIIDPDGPDGAPIGMFESGAILIYLAEKTGQFMPAGGAARIEVLQWLMWQIGGVGPMFGQMGWFVAFAGAAVTDPKPRQRYVEETIRLLEVLDHRLSGRDYISDWGYSIADMATFPWVRAVLTTYQARELVDWDDLDHVPAWLDRCLNRPAVQSGLHLPGS
jgi:GST-like protein